MISGEWVAMTTSKLLSLVISFKSLMNEFCQEIWSDTSGSSIKIKELAGLYPFRKEKNWVKKHYFEGSQAIKIYAITTRVPGLNIRFFLWI